MSKLTHACLIAGLAAAGLAHAQNPGADDPHLWLEDITGPVAMDWVRQQNAKSQAALVNTPQFKTLEREILSILDSDANLPKIEKIGTYYYNFWQDEQHPRGVWRRTTLDEYSKPQPKWETVLDLDAVNAAEGENWVWHGAECLQPQYQRCLIALSRGGADADVTREFDLENKRWVEGGFYRPEAKGALGWIDQDTVYVYTDFGPGSTTIPGFPRIVKQWKRGTPIESASVVYEGKREDALIIGWRDHSPGFERDLIRRIIGIYNDELYLRGQDGALTRIDAPNSAEKTLFRDWLVLELREPWQVGGKEYPAGALLATNLEGYMAGKRDMHLLFEPTAKSSLSQVTFTRNYLVLNVLEDVNNRVTMLTHRDGQWVRESLHAAPWIGSTTVTAVDSAVSDDMWMNTTDFLTPSALWLVGPMMKPEELKSSPVFFDGSKHMVEQHFAVSKDGTRVPYFMVRPKQLAFDGKSPTLMHGYGGFQMSLTPKYDAAVGKGWLEKGGTYVVANIRGGGEYGPRWHQAALRQHRHKSYEDFAAIADDLVARRVTSPKRLGAIGASNGGLLTGNMLTQYPEKFGAIVSQAPLLDMQRFHKLLTGAVWVSEYGNPDKPEDWAFIRTFSPYHLFNPIREYPPALFTTSTRDDRVHPGHARKMTAKMLEAGKQVHYYENIEGGHGGSADNRQTAHMQALAYTFLWNTLNQAQD